MNNVFACRLCLGGDHRIRHRTSRDLQLGEGPGKNIHMLYNRPIKVQIRENSIKQNVSNFLNRIYIYTVHATLF